MPIEIETIPGRNGANFFVSRRREIVFVSGRMGCGKTTWIREQIARDEAQGLRILFATVVALAAWLIWALAR